MQTVATSAARAERERFSAILALPEAKGREDRALKMAMTTDMSADEIRGIFAAETSSMWGAALTSRGMKVKGA